MALLDLRDSQPLAATFQAVFESAPMGMLIAEHDGRIVLANARLAAIFGYSTAELEGMSIDQLVPERHRPAHAAHRHDFRRHPGLRSMGAGRDLTGRHKDGSEVPIEIGLNAIEWPGGRAVLATVTDISVRKKLETDLHLTNVHLEEFTYVASHDLRSPLRGIADLLEWIEEELAEHESPSIRRNVDRAKLRIGRMEQIIDDLLVYARSGRVSTELVEVDPRELVQSVLELQPLPPGFEAEVRVESAPFKAARTPLETTLRNLVANAVKHHDHPASGHLRIHVTDEDAFCRLSVSDDGPGIPEAARERVFRLFQTVSASERQGSGIGLAVSKRMVESHGGRIHVEGGAQGSTFHVLWPRFPRRERHDH